MADLEKSQFARIFAETVSKYEKLTAAKRIDFDRAQLKKAQERLDRLE